jgi:hypothetical protein
VYPAESEWWTVLRHFPADWPLPDPLPAPSAIKNDWRYGLTAVWTMPHLAPFGQKDNAHDLPAKDKRQRRMEDD